jgi:hypothetical protein
VRKLLYILIPISVLFLSSCGSKSTGKSEGIITYKVSYPKMDKKNFMLDFMPKKMVLKFKDNKYITSLSAGMGMFQTKFIIDPEEEQFSQLVKLIDKKYSLTLKGSAVKESINRLPKFHVKALAETKNILNYTSKKVEVSIENKENEVFNVFFTDEIEIENPNSTNQFKDIKGVLLEYQYEKYGICMEFKATAIEFTKVEDSEFDLDKEYKAISEIEMNKEMQEIFDSFK